MTIDGPDDQGGVGLGWSLNIRPVRSLPDYPKCFSNQFTIWIENAAIH